MEVLAEKFRGLSKGLLPAAGRKGGKFIPNPTPEPCPECFGLLLQGKVFKALPNPAKGTWSQSPAANQVLKPCILLVLGYLGNFGGC